MCPPAMSYDQKLLGRYLIEAAEIVEQEPVVELVEDMGVLSLRLVGDKRDEVDGSNWRIEGTPSAGLSRTLDSAQLNVPLDPRLFGRPAETGR